MQIVSAAIQLGSRRQYAERHSRNESLQFQNANGSLNLQQRGLRGSFTESRERSLSANLIDRVDISPMLASSGAQTVTEPLIEDADDKTVGNSLDEEDVYDPKSKLIEMLLDKVFKKKVKSLGVKDFLGEDKNQPSVAFAVPGSRTGPAAQPANGPNFSLAYDYHESYYEAEQTSMSASGTVTTADGKEISFNLDLNMSREFYKEENISIRAGQQLTDPLVLNFNGQAAQLTDNQFAFDLDSDGEAENMRFVTSGSGFLAFDRNGDGTINDGSELFGPTTGNGFSELAELDIDGNNFIDAGDDAFNQLRIYNKSASGEDQLQSLSDAGVGAIYLDNVSTEFRMTDANNETLAQVSRSGVFIGENGEVGSVQQLDFATEEPGAETDETAAENPAVPEFEGPKLADTARALDFTA